MSEKWPDRTPELWKGGPITSNISYSLHRLAIQLSFLLTERVELGKA